MAYETKEAIAELGKIDPELDAFLKSGGDVGDIFATLAAMSQIPATESTDPSEKEYVVYVRMRDGFNSQLRVHKPSTPPEDGKKLPLAFLVFGGGFVRGDNKQFSPLSRALANLYNIVVVTTGYRLAPEYKWPTAPNDVWDNLEWVSKNASTLGADLNGGFVIGGASAGGNLAGVTAQKFVTEKLSPPLTGLWLNVPLLFDDSNIPEKYREHYFAKEQNADAPVIAKKDLDRINAAYEPDFSSPLYSPINAPNASKGLPPTWIQVAGMDPLRDDGLIYERILRENGVKTYLDVYPGVPHAHGMLPFLTQAMTFQYDSIRGFKRLLGVEVGEDEVEKAVQGLLADYAAGMAALAGK